MGGTPEDSGRRIVTPSPETDTVLPESGGQSQNYVGVPVTVQISHGGSLGRPRRKGDLPGKGVESPRRIVPAVLQLLDPTKIDERVHAVPGAVGVVGEDHVHPAVPVQIAGRRPLGAIVGDEGTAGDVEVPAVSPIDGRVHLLLVGMGVGKDQVDEPILIEVPSIHQLDAAPSGNVGVGTAVAKPAVNEILEAGFLPDLRLRLAPGRNGARQKKQGQPQIPAHIRPPGYSVASLFEVLPGELEQLPGSQADLPGLFLRLRQSSSRG